MTILMPIAAFLGTVLVDVVMAVFRVIKSLWDNGLKPLVDFLIDILAIALQGVIDVWNAWKPAIEVVFGVLMWLWDNALKPLVDFFVNILCGAIEGFGIGGIIDFIAGVFTGNWKRAWQGVQDIFGGIMNGLQSLVKAPLNGVIGLINGAISGLNKIKLPSIDIPFFGTVGGWGFNIPKIPYLAKGGIVDSATLAVIGEAGKEAVMPLENNTGWISLLADKLASRMPVGSNDSSFAGDLILMIDGSVIGKIALKQLKKMQRQGGITLMPV